jgi:hypothetical protein
MERTLGRTKIRFDWHDSQLGVLVWTNSSPTLHRIQKVDTNNASDRSCRGHSFRVGRNRVFVKRF